MLHILVQYSLSKQKMYYPDDDNWQSKDENYDYVPSSSSNSTSKSSLMRSSSQKPSSSSSSYKSQKQPRLEKSSSMRTVSSSSSSTSTSSSHKRESSKNSDLGRKCSNIVSEQRARFYIMKRCVKMLVCWPKNGDS
ncbi:small polypeptide DEVIL 13-like [Impatiens glandulifera]|uniref:small polypeptide DEVIL 13-like n=1 Tax=Impatiens glandulifera TaxID=253017 RepID=UPI001FB09ADA|nr:small polypeptide DEVIL 13-like [Impatiens glandulifera]